MLKLGKVIGPFLREGARGPTFRWKRNEWNFVLERKDSIYEQESVRLDGRMARRTLSEGKEGLLMPPVSRAPAPVAGPNRLDYVYRCDGRAVEDISKNGFRAWIELPLEELRDFVRFAAGVKSLSQTIMGSKLNPHAGIYKELGCPDRNALFDAPMLQRHIISTTLRGPWVSTDPERSCGGRTTGKIFRIDMSRMKAVPWSEAVKGAKSARLWPHLLLNGSTVEDSTCFALQAHFGATKEVTFLGSIPREWVTVAV